MGPRIAVLVSGEAGDRGLALELITLIERAGGAPWLVAIDDDLEPALRRATPAAAVVAASGSAAVRALSRLELAGIPHCGSSADACIVASDRVRSRQILAYHNLPVPASVVLSGERKTDERALELLGWPCTVRPRRGEPDDGTDVFARDDVARAVEIALLSDDELVLERRIEGRDIRVAMLGDRVLGVAEIFTRTLEGRVVRDMAVPPELTRARLDGIHALARRAVVALGLDRSVAQVDLIVRERHNEVVSQVIPCPELGTDSVVRRCARAAGLRPMELLAELVVPMVVATERLAQEPQATVWQ
jgi:D-alanine-D-alanine ligase